MWLLPLDNCQSTETRHYKSTCDSATCPVMEVNSYTDSHGILLPPPSNKRYSCVWLAPLCSDYWNLVSFAEERKRLHNGQIKLQLRIKELNWKMHMNRPRGGESEIKKLQKELHKGKRWLGKVKWLNCEFLRKRAESVVEKHSVEKVKRR